MQAYISLVLRNLINHCKAVVDISPDKLNQEPSKFSSETYEKTYFHKKLQCQWRSGNFQNKKTKFS